MPLPLLQLIRIQNFPSALADVWAGYFLFLAWGGGLSIGIGDVSGHGLAAGMVMAMARKALSLRARASQSPAVVLAKLNTDILPDMEEQMFVTALHGVLDPHTHTFVLAQPLDRVDESWFEIPDAWLAEISGGD